jgi:hypothetical protein
MYTLLISAISLMGTLASAQPAGGPGSETITGRPEPCYVVIAVDVSGRMESADAPVSDTGGRRQTLRDEGQLVFLQLLPFLYGELYVGVTHFSDRVRYSLPSESTGPLLPWGQTYLNESACRNLVRPAEFQATFHSDLSDSMRWALERIRVARRQHGQGPGKLILLSNGNPSDSVRELNRGGPTLDMAKRLAQQQIQVYPISIDGPAFRSADGRLPTLEPAVVDLMHSVASMTGGKAYRLARDAGFTDILMDVFGMGTQVRGDLVVSPHDWAILMVGSPIESVALAAEGAGARVLAANGGLETAPEIRASIISASRHRTAILRRPDSGGAVSRCWQGPWKIALPADNPQAAVRIYRVPDVLLRLEATPDLPWWRHERVQMKARLLNRHAQRADFAGTEAPAGGQNLSIRIQATATDEANSFALDKGRWTTPGRQFETEPFTVAAPGLYKLTCELRDAVAQVNVPVLYSTGDIYVHAECVGLEIVNAATNQVLQAVPPVAGPVRLEAQGGQQVYFRASGKGEFNVETLSGVLHLEPLELAQWSLRKDDQGRLVTEPVSLVEREEQLTGWAEVDVRTFAGVRHIQLPRFEMVYAPAPLRVECTFTDPREALWVGEFHRQPVNISAFPVFERFRDQTLRLFPETLPDARIRTVDMRSGTAQVMGPEGRLLEQPQPQGYEGRTVTATYFVESSVPIPPSDKCEVDVSAAVPDLRGAIKTYAVVDPAAQGLFRWGVQQGPADERGPVVSQTLFCGEPIRFSAEWRADQNVSGLRFEIPRPAPAEPVSIEVPVASGTNQAQTEQMVFGLNSGETVPVYVYVTMQPAGADHPLHVKLKGGQFRAEDRRVVLKDLRIGDGTPTDIPAYAWEPVEVPLRAVFSGYAAGNLQHSAVIEQFKKSCALTVTPRAGEVQNITGTIEWSSVAAQDSGTVCELKGRATYTPRMAGRVAVELKVEAPTARGTTGVSVEHAYAQVLAREPRLAVTVHRLTPGGAEPVFDSRKWVQGDGDTSALTTRLSTRLRIDIQNGDPAGGPPGSWKTTTRLLRRATPNADWIAVSSEAGELAADRSFVREVQVTDNGEYALEVTGQDGQTGRSVQFRTPVIAFIRQYEVVPAVAPPAWLSSRVRQWPFEYRVMLYQDSGSGSRPQAVAFQFQLPAEPQTWLEGATAPAPAETADIQQLLARAPRFLPAVDSLRDGKVQFRLASQGLEFLRWECPSIRVIPPVLEGLVLSRQNNGAAVAWDRAELAFDASTDLWVRPAFRAAPELASQWTPAKTTIYVWRDRGPAGAQAEVRVLEELQERAAVAGGTTDLQAFTLDGNAADRAVKILSRRARWNFWGLPRPGAKERYSVVASVAYQPKQVAAASPGQSQPRTIAEWSDVYAINLDAPWAVPLLWWPLTAALLAAGIVALLRLSVPSPSRLALDLRLEENVAIVEPVRLDNPVLLDLHETPLAKEIQLCTRYLGDRWELARRSGGRPESFARTAQGTLLRGLAWVVGPLQVLLRRAFRVRRYAWAAIIPRIRGDARRVHTALLCVWTGLGTRRGRLWSSQGGALELPHERQTKSISLDLPYQANGVDRTMRVTVRVRRMASEEMEMTAPGWQQTSSELNS